MTIEYLPKRDRSDPFDHRADDDWIRITDFCDRAVYLRPQEALGLVAEVARLAAAALVVE